MQEDKVLKGCNIYLIFCRSTGRDQQLLLAFLWLILLWKPPRIIGFNTENTNSWRAKVLLCHTTAKVLDLLIPFAFMKMAMRKLGRHIGGLRTLISSSRTKHTTQHFSLTPQSSEAVLILANDAEVRFMLLTFSFHAKTIFEVCTGSILKDNAFSCVKFTPVSATPCRLKLCKCGKVRYGMFLIYQLLLLSRTCLINIRDRRVLWNVQIASVPKEEYVYYSLASLASVL